MVSSCKTINFIQLFCRSRLIWAKKIQCDLIDIDLFFRKNNFYWNSSICHPFSVRRLDTLENEAIAYASIRHSDIENIRITGIVDVAPIDPAIHEMRIFPQKRTSDPVPDNDSNHSPRSPIHSPTTLSSDQLSAPEKLKGWRKKSIFSGNCYLFQFPKIIIKIIIHFDKVGNI